MGYLYLFYLCTRCPLQIEVTEFEQMITPMTTIVMTTSMITAVASVATQKHIKFTNRQNARCNSNICCGATSASCLSVTIGVQNIKITDILKHATSFVARLFSAVNGALLVQNWLGFKQRAS